MKIDPVELSKDLISCPSVTPKDEGALDILQEALEPLGFNCIRKTLSTSGYEDVENLYAQYGDNSGNNLCFAGHTDVVPPGDLKDWDSDPFIPEIRDGYLYGRGASDMKCAIACFVSAVSEYLENNDPDFSISFLITGDEEAIAINGTDKFLTYLTGLNKKITSCIVGEPTNPENLGDMIKIGRRGSVSFDLTINGIQGHIAYPLLAQNPVNIINKILYHLQTYKLDDGNDYFQPSNFEIVTIDVGNLASNVIPATSNAKFNIRFNDEYTGIKLVELINSICKEHCDNADYELKHRISGESFITKPGTLSSLMQDAIKKVSNLEATLSTEGGTSDARFIKNYCPVIEFGLINKTAHKINESARVKDISNLKDIYLQFLHNYSK